MKGILERIFWKAVQTLTELTTQSTLGFTYRDPVTPRYLRGVRLEKDSLH